MYLCVLGYHGVSWGNKTDPNDPIKNKDGCCQLGFSVSLIFHKNNKSVSAKIITGLSLLILSAEKGQNLFKLWCSF